LDFGDLTRFDDDDDDNTHRGRGLHHSNLSARRYTLVFFVSFLINPLAARA